MPTIAFWSTKWTMDIAKKLIKADVRLHNSRFIRDDMSIIYVVNHFTRLETFLIPYELLKHLGKEVWSLAADELFVGRLGSYLRSMGAVSTKDPDRDKIIVRGLLAGDHPWIIFPEGQMIKDKKVVNHRREFSVYNQGLRRPPHRGAAVLALRTELYREKLRRLAAEGHQEQLAQVLARFDLESPEEALKQRTAIVPVNVTYYPIRAGENVFLRIARSMARDLSPRAIEELSVEGTLLAEDTDIDLTLGEPIDIRDYLAANRPELLSPGDHDIEALEADPRSPFTEAAKQLTLRYMREIYDNTTLNYDHILATLIRHQRSKTFTERAYRDRVFLAAHRIRNLGRYRLHPLIERTYRDILYEEPNPQFQEFLSLCVEEGIVRRQGEHYFRDFSVRQGETEFHLIRQKEMNYVVANEIEPLEDVTAIIRDIARTPHRRLAKAIRHQFLDEDAAIFEADYTAHFREDLSKPREVGRPFLLSPKLRVRGGIVLVHGYLAAPLEVRALAEYLFRKGFAVYGVRLKGHGTSPEDLARTSWEEWYESVNRGYAVIKTITDNIVMGGFSTGGALALLAAARKGPKVHAAFAINAPLHLRNYTARLAPSIVSMNTLFQRVRRGSLQWEYVANRPENAHINYTRNPLSGVRELGRVMDVMGQALPVICAPTLIVQGSRDPVVNPVSGSLIFEKVGTIHKELALLERDRHGIVNGPGSHDVFEHVHRFLERVREVPCAPDPAGVAPGTDVA